MTDKNASNDIKAYLAASVSSIFTKRNITSGEGLKVIQNKVEEPQDPFKELQYSPPRKRYFRIEAYSYNNSDEGYFEVSWILTTEADIVRRPSFDEVIFVDTDDDRVVLVIKNEPPIFAIHFEEITHAIDEPREHITTIDEAPSIKDN